jgi:glutaredoxin-related protein
MGELKRWMSKLFTKTFSVAFHHFSRNEMSFEQTKIYCSMNILYNIIKLNKSQPITSDAIEQLDRYLQTDVLAYLQKKYPLTESQAVNRTLDSAVQEMDNLGALSNTYFCNSSVGFEYRESGNYNDLVMRMLNDILSRLDQPSPFLPSRRSTNFTDFKKYMTELFESVEEDDDAESLQEEVLPNVVDFIADRIGRNMKSSLKDALPMKDSSKIRQIEREKYRSKVREYTEFKIGRKVP